MKNLKKKGFTIVELVIVIAVIAILSAVLIPTFSSLIKKANMSADQQAVKELNNGLIIGSIEKDPQTIDEVANALNEAGYNSFEVLSPISKGFNFYWLKNTNQIVLVEVETNEIKFAVKGDEVDFAAELAAGNAFNLKRVAGSIEVDSLESFREAISKGQSVTITEDFDLSEKFMTIDEGEDVVLQLNDNAVVTIGYSDKPNNKHHYATYNYGILTIQGNGTIESRGLSNYGKIIIEDGITVKSIDNNGGAAIWNYENGEVIINGGNFEATSGDFANDSNSVIPEPGVINNSGKITINGGIFEALKTGCYAINNTGELVINDGTFKAWRGVVSSTDNGKVVINGGKFEKTSIENSGQVFYVEGANASIEINDATIIVESTTYELKAESFVTPVFAGYLDSTNAPKFILKQSNN